MRAALENVTTYDHYSPQAINNNYQKTALYQVGTEVAARQPIKEYP